MMRLRIAVSLLWISLSIALDHEPVTSFHSLDSCAWSPLQVPELQLCRTLPREETQTQVQTSRKSENSSASHAHPKELWQGPHACVGVFCVYSNPTFASGRGIVVITTARSAKAISRFPVFAEDSAERSNANNKTLPTPPLVDDPPFRIAQVPGKGLGVIATRRIVRGQRIMTYPAVLIAPQRFIDGMTKDQQARLLDAAVRQLPASTADLFMALMGQAGGPNKSVDIMMTNSFGMILPILGDGTYFGVFPEVSRYNHDCRPNVQFYIDSGLTHHTHAVKDIHPGEELALSYGDPFRARAVRQDRTQRSWGFKCTCAHCALPDTLANMSDDRLWQIYEVENRIADWNDATITPQTIELLLSLYEQERLNQSHASDALVHAALNYNAFGREDLATKYAMLALEAGMLEKGPESHHVHTMKALLSSPRDHWSWQKRMPV